MTTTEIVRLGDVRGRRRERYERSEALFAADSERLAILRHLWRLAQLTDADRSALVWVDEYGPGLVHPHVVLDLGSDEARRDISIQLLQKAWAAGVPGLVDVRDDRTILTRGYSPASSAAVSLGSDGLRAWFLMADSSRPRSALSPDVCEEVMFEAGECAAIVLHRDLDGVPEVEDSEGGARLSAWSVLRDLDEADEDAPRNRRIATRFLVLRAIRQAIEDDLVVDMVGLREMIRGVRQEVGRVPAEVATSEVEDWNRVLDLLEQHDWAALGDALLQWGLTAEHASHTYGSREIQRATLDLALSIGASRLAVDAMARLGLAERRLGDWEAGLTWYNSGAELARAIRCPDREVQALVGELWVHYNRGDMPTASAVATVVRGLLAHCKDHVAKAKAYHAFASIAHTAGELEPAARDALRSAQLFGPHPLRFEAVTALGGVLLEGRNLDEAEKAFRYVLAGCRDETFTLYAALGLSEIAAFRGDRGSFERQLQAIHRDRFESRPPEFQAEVLLEWGDCYLSLGDEDQAVVWYHRALETAERFSVAEYVIRAETALTRLSNIGDPSEQPSSDGDSLTDLGREEIRGGLDALLEAESLTSR